MWVTQSTELIWQIAAIEAVAAKQQFIEKEHIFIALCKASEIDKIDDKMKAELQAVDELFEGANLNKVKIRRHLRKVVGTGGYEHKEGVIHRSKECKEVFSKAAELAERKNEKSLQPIHLLFIILSEPGDKIQQVLGSAGIELEPFKKEDKEAWLRSMQKISSEEFRRLIEEAKKDEKVIEKHRIDLAIMFTDLKGSVEYYQEKGTILGRCWVEEHNSLLFPIIREHKGWIIKTIGDAIMAAFDSPKEALSAAISMQRALYERNNKIEEEREHHHIRIGIHYGRVLFEGKDVSGNVVNIAARVEAICAPDEILISAALYEAVKDEPFEMTALGKKCVKETEVDVYRLEWKDSMKM